jgi:hypothetical protein
MVRDMLAESKVKVVESAYGKNYSQETKGNAETWDPVDDWAMEAMLHRQKE